MPASSAAFTGSTVCEPKGRREPVVRGGRTTRADANGEASVRRRTTLVVGGAAVVALALGALLGGVRARPPSAASSAVASGTLAERALGATAGGVTEAT